MWYAEGVKGLLLAAGFLRFQFHRKSPAHLAGLFLYRGGAGSFRDTDVTGVCRRAGVKRGKDHNVKNLFDLQRFAAEAEQAENAENVETAEAIPAELAGVSEESAREAMQVAKAQAEPAESAEAGGACRERRGRESCGGR